MKNKVNYWPWKKGLEVKDSLKQWPTVRLLWFFWVHFFNHFGWARPSGRVKPSGWPRPYGQARPSGWASPSGLYVNNKNVAGECPSGWLNGGELGGCYRFYPNGPDLDFYQAKDFCVSEGGFLTDILNQETQDFLDNSGFRQRYPSISWWIGGCDNAIVSFVFVGCATGN